LPAPFVIVAKFYAITPASPIRPTTATSRWYAEHPRAMTVREDHLLDVIGRFFGERVLEPRRHLYLSNAPTTSESASTADAVERATLHRKLEQLNRT
jgi:hypothetical protein